MKPYQRLGPFLLAQELATVPSGKLHRAISTSGGAFERHHLLHVFSAEVTDAGLAGSWAQAGQVAGQLSGGRCFGANYRFGAGSPAHLSCDLVPGRSLAQVLAAVRAEQVPFGVNHALTVLQSAAQAIVLMHGLGIHHGTLSPHSIWISYDGAVQMLDAPVAAVLQVLLPDSPALDAALAPYRPADPADAFRQDLFALGAVLYEMLTLEALPGGPDLPGVLARASLRAAQEDGGIPGDLLQLLAGMLVAAPACTAAEFNGALERVLYDGDYSPTTFNLAFLMHTLFRDGQEADALAMKAEQAASYAPARDAAGVPRPPQPGGRSPRFYLLAGALMLASGLFASLLYATHQSNRQFRLEEQSLEAKLAAFEREKAANDAKLADLARREERQRTLAAAFDRQAQEGGTEAARAEARKDLESARQDARKLAEERAEALYYSRQLIAQENAARAQPQAAP